MKTDQTGQMPRLIGVFTVCTCYFVGFAMQWLIFLCDNLEFVRTTINPFIPEIMRWTLLPLDLDRSIVANITNRVQLIKTNNVVS